MNKKQPAPAKKAPAKSAARPKAKASTTAVADEAKSTHKKSKIVKTKVIRGSFPFPEREYGELSALKKTCIAAGIPIKRGEILRAGLNLLSRLDFPEIIRLVEQVEKIQSSHSSAANH